MERNIKKTRSSSMRQFLRDVLKPTPALSTLGKRGRSDDETSNRSRPIASPCTSNSVSTTSPTPKPYCIALQNEDTAEDAIVITALNVAPFCCHADLMTMTRPELLQVASILNAKLPRALHIDVSPSCSDVAIRYAIELLVGLRDKPPHQPAPPTTMFTMVYNTFRNTPTIKREPPSPGAQAQSPLTRRSRPSMSFRSPTLPIVREDSREREDSPKPPQKKRRTDAPITRALSYRIAPFLASEPHDSPSPRMRGSIPLARTLTLDGTADRAASAKKSPKKPRGGSRYARARSLHANMTSTPKRSRSEAAVNSPAAAQAFRSLLGDMQNTVGHAGGAKSQTEKTHQGNGWEAKGTKGRASGRTTAPREDSTLASVKAEELEVTFGIDGMTMPIASAYGEASDMSISYGF